MKAGWLEFWRSLTEGEPWPIKLMVGTLVGCMVAVFLMLALLLVMVVLGLTGVVPFNTWGGGGYGGSHGVIIIGGHPYFH